MEKYFEVMLNIFEVSRGKEKQNLDLYIKNLDPNQNNIDETSYKNILTYYSSYETINKIKPLYLIIKK